MTEGEFAPWVEGLIRAEEHDRKLLPCPFCGSTDIEIRMDERDCCYIHCLICDAWVSTGIFEPSYDEIVELWNKRVKE